MKHITLLHTVRSVYETFADQLREAMPEEVLIDNTLDEFLASDPNRRGGEFTLGNENRLRYILQAKDLEGADLIIVSCSTLTPSVSRIRPAVKTPVLAIDDAMMEKAVETGTHILVIATAQSAMGPAKQKVLEEAAKSGRAVDLDELLCFDAFKAIQRMDKSEHDRLLKEAAAQITSKPDVIVLAQASMAHLQQDIQAISGCPTLSSPSLCFDRARRTLYGKDK